MRLLDYSKYQRVLTVSECFCEMMVSCVDAKILIAVLFSGVYICQCIAVYCCLVALPAPYLDTCLDPSTCYKM